jgi:formylglycine-generating enzyme required for sulfatase activity
VLRGGSFNGSPDYCRATFRGHRHPSFINYFDGFRAARACSP